MPLSHLFSLLFISLRCRRLLFLFDDFDAVDVAAAL